MLTGIDGFLRAFLDQLCGPVCRRTVNHQHPAGLLAIGVQLLDQVLGDEGTDLLIVE
jgi:hypothetical protein